MGAREAAGPAGTGRRKTEAAETANSDSAGFGFSGSVWHFIKCVTICLHTHLGIYPRVSLYSNNWAQVISSGAYIQRKLINFNKSLGLRPPNTNLEKHVCLLELLSFISSTLNVVTFSCILVYANLCVYLALTFAVHPF